MKNIKFLSGLFLIFIAFSSCTNEPIDPNINLNDFATTPAGPAVFKADFSGNTWVATATAAIVSGNTIVLNGANSNGEGFAIYVQSSTVGTYSTGGENLASYQPAGSEFSYQSINFSNPSEVTGSIIVSNIDTVNKTISGTFSFKGYWSNTDTTSILPVQFTNGVFTNIPYITQAETGDTFYAKVNGTEFVDVDLLASVTTIGTQEWISVGAQDANLDSMTVSVRSNVTPGTYSITGNVSVDQAQAIYNFGDTDYSSISGSVTVISKTATRIKGTFQFVTDGTSPFNVTEGTFDVAY